MDSGTWNLAASILGAVGGLIGVVFGGLGIWYARAGHIRAGREHELVFTRWEREEEDRRVLDRATELRRLAYESVQQTQSASSMLEVRLKLDSDLDRKAAWLLVDEGVATVKGDECAITVDRLPKALRDS